MGWYDSALSHSEKSVAFTNTFMRSIYNWMVIGLGITAAVTALCMTPAVRGIIFSEKGFMVLIAGVVIELGLVFYLSSRIQKLAASTATTLFLLFSAVMGVTLAFTVARYTTGSVLQAFLTATAMFAGMSVYGMTTKRDLTSIGSFCIMGLIGVIVASIINMIFFQSGMMSMIFSAAIIVVFLGLTAYDTQTFKEMSESLPENDPAAVHRASILGALSLYLNFINIFVHLLRFMGDRE